MNTRRDGQHHKRDEQSHWNGRSNGHVESPSVRLSLFTVQVTSVSYSLYGLKFIARRIHVVSLLLALFWALTGDANTIGVLPIRLSCNTVHRYVLNIERVK